MEFSSRSFVAELGRGLAATVLLATFIGSTNAWAMQDAPAEPTPAEPTADPTPAAEPAPAEPAATDDPAPAEEPAASDPPAAEPPSVDDAMGAGGPAITPPASTPAAGLKDAVESAQNAMSSANWRQAIDAWTSVLAIDPGNSAATAGLKQAQAMLDQASTIDNVQEDFSLRRERLKVQFQDDMVRSNSSYDEGDYRKARENAVTARLRVDRDRGVLPADQYASMMKQIDTMLDRVAAAEQLESLAKDEAKRDQARTAASAERRKEQEDRQRTINESLQRVRQLQMELKYDEAIQVLDTVLFIDPNNPAANALRDVIRTSSIYREYSQTLRRRDYAFSHFHARESGSHDSPLDELEWPRPPINFRSDGLSRGLAAAFDPSRCRCRVPRDRRKSPCHVRAWQDRRGEFQEQLARSGSGLYEERDRP